MSEPWFHGFLKPTEIESLLKSNDHGAFLVRFSNTNSRGYSFIISRNASDGSIKHIIVPYEPGKGLKLDDYYTDMVALIKKNREVLRLLKPCPGRKCSYIFDTDSS